VLTKATILSLQTALAEATIRAEEAVNQRQTEALEREQKLTAELRETLDRFRTESSLTEERLRAEIDEIKRQLDAEQSTAKSLKEELTAEISVVAVRPVLI
jgi:hypothetical protein